MNIIFFLFFLPYHCYAGITDWFSLPFLSKSYRAVKAYQDQNYNEAFCDFDNLINQDPYNPEYNYNIGAVLYRQKKYDDALSSFLRAAEQKTCSHDIQEQAYFNAGNSSYQLQRWRQAIELYKKVLSLHPGHAQAEHNLKLALYALQEEQMKNQSQKEDTQDKQEKMNDQMNSGCNQDQAMDDKNQSQDNSSSSKNQKNKGGQKGSSNIDNDDESDGDESESQADQKDQKDSDRQEKQGKEKDTHSQGQEDRQDVDDDGDQDAGGISQNHEENDNSDEKNKDYDALQEDLKNKMADQEKKLDSLQNQKGNEDQQGLQKDNEQVLQEESGDAHDGSNDEERVGSGEEKKDTGTFYKKPELKNEMQQEYESKASDDERLTEYHALIMKTLEDLEEKIQKHVIKNQVGMQGAGRHDQKGW